MIDFRKLSADDLIESIRRARPATAPGLEPWLTEAHRRLRAAEQSALPGEQVEAMDTIHAFAKAGVERWLSSGEGINLWKAIRVVEKALRAATRDVPAPTSELREALAALEHEQWMAWAKSLMQSEHLSVDRCCRWDALFVPYAKLTEEQKDQDRKWADKVLALSAAHPAPGPDAKLREAAGEVVARTGRLQRWLLSEGRSDPKTLREVEDALFAGVERLRALLAEPPAAPSGAKEGA